MDIAEYIQALERDGKLLAEVAEKAGPDAPVPSCPQWQVRDLLLHMGSVHRWAAGFVTEKRTEGAPLPDAPELADDALVPWLRAGHGALVQALRAAPADLACWTFLPSSSPIAFWTRRQAHETAVHRVDAELALGAPPTPFDAPFAADGIDELLVGFHSRHRSKVRTDTPRTLFIRAADMPSAAWSVHLTDAPPSTERTAPEAESEADCVIAGPASDLYLALWNRLSWDSLTISGDGSLAQLWRERSAT